MEKFLKLIGEKVCVRTALMIAWAIAAVVFAVCNTVCHLLGHGDITYYWDGATMASMLAALSYSGPVWKAVHDIMFGKEEPEEEESK